MRKRIVNFFIFAVLCLAFFVSCGKDKDINPNLDLKKDVTLIIGGKAEDCAGIDLIGAAFTKKYPNCKVTYEFLNDYDNNIEKRLNNEDDCVDIFYLNSNSQHSNYAIDFYQNLDKIDLSNCFEGLIVNSTIVVDGQKTLKMIPLGAEIRGMFVNKTLLKKYDLDVPKNKTELLEACKVLKDNGFIPLQRNPSSFAQTIMYPSVCNKIANSSNYEETYNMVNKKEEGIIDLLDSDLQFLYELVDKKYYEYKKTETTLNNFIKDNEKVSCLDFLNIKLKADNETYERIDNIGNVAFMPGIQSFESTLDKYKSDYHSEIDYEFILSPVGDDDGGYAYLSPSSGLSINKETPDLDWALEFMDFLFEKKNNKKYADCENQIPNTSDAPSYISKMFDVNENQISHLGQVTFEYNFYQVLFPVLLTISKANNPKYMDCSNPDSPVMYPYSYYKQKLIDAFK